MNPTVGIYIFYGIHVGDSLKIGLNSKIVANNSQSLGVKLICSKNLIFLCPVQHATKFHLFQFSHKNGRPF